MVAFKPEQGPLPALTRHVVQEHLCAEFARAPLAEVPVDEVEYLHVDHGRYRDARHGGQVQRDEVEPSLQYRGRVGHYADRPAERHPRQRHRVDQRVGQSATQRDVSYHLGGFPDSGAVFVGELAFSRTCQSRGEFALQALPRGQSPVEEPIAKRTLQSSLAVPPVPRGVGGLGMKRYGTRRYPAVGPETGVLADVQP